MHRYIMRIRMNYQMIEVQNIFGLLNNTVVSL